MKKFFLPVIVLFLALSASAQENFTFGEIWAYLSSGEESSLKASYPITDIGYFGADINWAGKLVNVPDRKKIKNFKGRVHLVAAQVSNRAVTHFVLDPSLPFRDKLIDDIVKASANFDGVQIDFELVPASDRNNFYSFLSILKKKLGKKTLSVAVSARIKYIDDAYEYEKIAAIVDRVIVMGYDEHWSSSAPGSVASLDWCKKTAEYALKTIPREKFVMGMPFYSRAWSNINPAKAYKYSGLKKLTADKNITQIEFKDGAPFFTYQETVNVTVFFEDSATAVLRFQIYSSMNIKNIAFWRLGQEDPAVWQALKKQ